MKVSIVILPKKQWLLMVNIVFKIVSVCLLMDKLQTWIGLTEMAKHAKPIFTIYTQGQQIKVFISYINIVCMKIL